MTVHFTVQEHQEKASLNTPGGDELMKRLGGTGGLPYFAFLDSRGNMVVSSNEPPGDGRKGGNIGHPSEPHEVDWFLTMLDRGVPQLRKAERATFEKYLREQKK